ncbi:hypothetical protein O181_064403 [Austropuccinia psidii MF-1]|uniref:Uncharacterized protein n=1 Tax=Austropuccinia psidii MF-1 TaxID=1389203 RepID=A0A9Q3EMX8_9BASI|nr:hypothetical protein [Austropuccinia psidii MF-1]
MKSAILYWLKFPRYGFKCTSEPNKECTGLAKTTRQYSEVKTLHFIYAKWSKGPFPFGQEELLELGHKVSDLILAMDQNKVAEALLKPVPKNIKYVQSFLRFASYYRNHIRELSHITSSLYKFCSKDVVFEITKERRYAYERIKHELTNAPVLILPDFKLPFR